MRVCDLNTGLGKLSLAFSHFKEKWLVCKEHWNDDTNRKFSEQHLRELPERFQMLLSAVQRLSDAIAKAEQDCSDRGVDF